PVGQTLAVGTAGVANVGRLDGTPLSGAVMKHTMTKAVGITVLGLLGVLSFDTPALAQTAAATGNAEDTPWFRQSPASNKYALIIVGAAANDDIRQRLRGWASELHGTLLND